MKKMLIVIALILIMVLLSGCSTQERETFAMVRYFDGSSEMLMLDHYRIANGVCYLYTADGSTVIIGQNNAIIIEEEVRNE